MKKLIFYIAIMLTFGYSIEFYAQDSSPLLESSMSLEEFLAQVKMHHPLAKQANLKISEGEANLLKARGAFDPKIDIDAQRKEFKDTEYYDILNSTFKIPTWFGIDLKANYENNSGQFLNPQLNVPDDGLLSAGVSVSVLDGLLMNDRMASLKQAKIYRNQTKAERDFLVNELIFKASNAYFEWTKAFQNAEIYGQYVTNARERFEGVIQSVEAGDKAAIDSVEAKINWQNRVIELENARIKLNERRLMLSNYLWLENVPVELQDNIVPLPPMKTILDTVFELQAVREESQWITSHPKLRIMNFKVENQIVDRQLKRNRLLPTLELEYNFLTEDFDQLSTFNQNNYKAGLRFKMPLFLRKERGALKLSNYKLQNAEWDRDLMEQSLKNTAEASFFTLETMEVQANNIVDVVTNTQQLLNAEQRKFDLGDSSLFLLISRERSLLTAQIKEVSVRTDWYKAYAKLFKALGITPASDDDQL